MEGQRTKKALVLDLPLFFLLTVIQEASIKLTKIAYECSPKDTVKKDMISFWRQCLTVQPQQASNLLHTDQKLTMNSDFRTWNSSPAPSFGPVWHHASSESQ